MESTSCWILLCGDSGNTSDLRGALLASEGPLLRRLALSKVSRVCLLASVAYSTVLRCYRQLGDTVLLQAKSMIGVGSNSDG